MNAKKIIKAYRRFWNGPFEVLEDDLTDEQAQKAIRGVGARREDFLAFAKEDLKDKDRSKKLQIKVEHDEISTSYLIYLNII